MTARALLPLLLVLLLCPSAQHHRLDGLPLSSLPEFAVFILLLPVLMSRGLRRLYLRCLARSHSRWLHVMLVAVMLALAAKVVLLRADHGTGFQACYQSAPARGETPATCERSYESPLSPPTATRIDDTIDFAAAGWNLSFFNSLRFNIYPWIAGNLERSRLPFLAHWQGAIDQREPGEGAIVYVGEGTLTILGSVAMVLPPSYLNPRTVTFPIPAGRRQMLLTYRFDDGSRVGDGVPRGPDPAVRLLSRVPSATGDQHLPLRSAGPSPASRAAGVFVDLATLTAVCSVLCFYWQLLERDKWMLAGACLAGLLLLADPTASMSTPPSFDYAKAESARGLPNGLGPTVLACVLFALLLRRPSTRHLLVAYFSVFWFSVFRQDFRLRGFDAVFHRPAGDDWLTYESFARAILESGSLEGGERVFYYQPLFRYLKFLEHVLFGDGDTLIALFAQATLIWAVFWMTARLLPRAVAAGVWKTLGLVTGLLLVVLVTSEPVSRLIFVGASEYPTWIALLLLFPSLFAATSPRQWRVGTLLVGLSLITRMNQALALSWMFLVFLWRLWPSRPRFAIGAVLVVAVLAVLPVLHNLYYGRQLIVLPQEHRVRRTLPLPPSSWRRVFEDAAVREQALTHIGALSYTTRLDVRSPMVPTDLSHRVVRLAVHGLQFMWGLAAFVSLTRTGVSRTTRLLLAVPFLYLVVHLFYQVVDYHPRFIVIGYLSMGVVVILAMKEKALIDGPASSPPRRRTRG